MSRGRVFRPKAASIRGTVYDSLLEKRLHDGPLKKCEFHNKKIPYHIEHVYNPDFTYTGSDGVELVIEAKGYFQDSSEASKYTWVKQALKDNQLLVFIFSDPDKQIHYQRKRKDGTKMTHREWCTKNGFICVSEKDAGELIK